MILSKANVSALSWHFNCLCIHFFFFHKQNKNLKVEKKKLKQHAPRKQMLETKVGKVNKLRTKKKKMSENK